MDFNLSVSGVANWLDALPVGEAAPTSNADTLKRQRSFKTNSSRKRQRPISPPESQSARAMPGDAPPSTPNTALGKRGAPAPDVDKTPTAPLAGGSRGPVSTAPSLSSQSDAAYSHDSKRSKRSQSPSKLFPVYGPEGHQLLRGSLMATPGLSRTLQELLMDMNDVAGRYCIMPRSVKRVLQQQLLTEGQFERLHEYMFFDDSATQPTCIAGEELVRRISRIASKSNDCSRMLSDEAAWNNHVHSPLLDIFIYDLQDGPGQNIIDFLSCTTTNIEPSYHRFPVSSSRVDYVLPLMPERDPTATKSLAPNMAPCFNWTADRQLQQYPLAISIETKRYGGNAAKGEEQLGIWHAAQWEFLISRAGVEAANELCFLPGVVVQGHSWSLVVSIRRQATTTILCSVEFGNTGSIVGVFQVLAGLRRLRMWSLDVLWKWYKKHLPGLSTNLDS
ncbi:hypothetical protein FALCPG4_018628 [Fusarium falciforme]